MVFQLVDPRRSIRMGNKEENEIREIFFRHWEKMKSQIQENINEINNWCGRNILKIEQYSKDQISRLQIDFKRQRAAFDQSRKEHLEIAKAYSEKKADEPLKDLYNACKKLEFQVAQLGYVQYKTKYPMVQTVEDLKNGRRINGIETQTSVCDDYRDQSTIDDASVREQDDDFSVRSYPQTPRSSNSTK